MFDSNKVESLPTKKPADNIDSINNTPSISLAERKFMRAKDAADYLSISKSHFHYLVRIFKLPKGKLLTGSVRVWKVIELDLAAEKMWEVE
jgi:hypothetical protein